MNERLTAAALIAAIALAPASAAAAGPRLIDQTGRSFTLSDLRGEPLVVTFVAAHCTDVCPLIDAQFAQVAAALARQNVRARLLTVTLDPRHDPPAVMRDLARRFGADPRRWLVASGNVRDVRAIMTLFGVVAQQGRRGYADVHTTLVYVLNARGKLRRRIFASNMLGTQLANELRSQSQELAR